MDLGSKNNQVVIGKSKNQFKSAPEMSNNHNSSRHFTQGAILEQFKEDSSQTFKSGQSQARNCH